MRGSVRAVLVAGLSPLALLAAGAVAVILIGVLELRGDVRAVGSRSLAALRAERFARDLQISALRSFDEVVLGEEVAQARVQAQDASRSSHERLSQLLKARPQPSDSMQERPVDAIDSMHDAVSEHGDRAVALAAGGRREEALRILTDDLELLLLSRTAERLEPLMRTEMRAVDSVVTHLTRMRSEHWLLSQLDTEVLTPAALAVVLELSATDRFTRHGYQELKRYAHHVLAGVPLDEEALRVERQGALRALRRLVELQEAALPGSPSGVEPEAAYRWMQGEYARVLVLAQDGRPEEAAAALRGVAGFLDEFALGGKGSVDARQVAAIAGFFRGLESLERSLISWTVAVAAIALLFAIGGPWLVMRRIADPLVRLASVAPGVIAGDSEWDAGIARGRSDEIGVVAGCFKDLASELNESSAKVRALAFYDNVTGLPNRQLFLERLHGAILTAKLYDHTMGVLSISLDSFEGVNDALGHSAGDELLRQVAGRLNRSVRLRDIVAQPSSSPEATTFELSRLGGAQFSILLHRLSDAQDAAMVAERVLRELAAGFNIDGHELGARANIGMAIFPVDGTEADSLLSNANAAVHHARMQRPNSYQFYSQVMNAQASRKLRIGARLRGALDRGDLMLRYQPFRDPRSGCISAAELLLRWEDSELGEVSPGEFIPIAEETGLIGLIGEWVIRGACRQNRAWQKAGYRPIRISVNVSSHQLRSDDLREIVATCLRETGLSADCFEIEITESAILLDDAATLDILNGIHDLGVGISLDDFGTGYSSLSYLKRFPIDRVKIDRSFVKEITQDSDGTELTAAILAMAKSLKLKVVAEGIETEEQASYLTSRGCDELQGFLISGPVPAQKLQRLLKEKSPTTIDRVA